MGINFKFMMKKEPPNYKKSFLVSLIVVLLISSLVLCMFAGQAMGQNENDNEPLTTRVIGSLIVTAGFAVLIIVLFSIIVKRKTENINPNDIKPPMGPVTAIFLGLVTLLFYLLYYLAAVTAKINVLSKSVYEKNNITKYLPIKFRATLAVTFLVIFLFPFIFTFVNAVLLNADAYTAIFNLDWASFEVAIGARYGFRLLLSNILFGSDALYAILLFGWIFCPMASVYICGRTAWVGVQRMKGLLKYYMENSVEYYEKCAVMLNTYDKNNYAFYDTFNLLIDCHHESLYTTNTRTG